MLETLIVIFALGASYWLWNDNLKAREAALQAGFRACRAVDAQLLDHTVALSSFRLGRNTGGLFLICRTYVFEFTADGFQRMAGAIVLHGLRVSSIQMEHAGGFTIVESALD